MKCVICKGSDIQLKMVGDEFKSGRDIVLVQLEVLVCQSCGERYYDKKTMRTLDGIRSKIKTHDLELEKIRIHNF